MAKKPKRRAFPHDLAPEPERDVVQPAKDRDYGPRLDYEVRGRIAPSVDDAGAFAQRLVELLHLAGVTLDDVATHLKFSLRQVKQWTKATHPTIPDAALLLALCRRYRFSPSYLLLGAGPPFLDQLTPSADLGEQLRVTLAERLRARDHDEPAIGAILDHDGDLLARLVATYDTRLRLIPAARMFGLSPGQLEFATQEIDVRLVVGSAARKKKTATRLAAEEYMAESRDDRSEPPPNSKTRKPAPRSAHGSTRRPRR